MVLHMSLVRVWTCSLVLLFFTSSCSLGSKSSEQEASILGPISRTYSFEYDKVWRALQKSLARYPIKVNNVDAGIIETDDIKGLKVWSPPHKPKVKQPGLRYNFKIALIRGEKQGKEATEVTIEKFLRINKNFFADEKRLPSDGLEEEGLHYRIQRELTIEKALDAAYEKDSQDIE